MAINSIEELTVLLNNLDTDALVLAAISNEPADSVLSGLSPGYVTTRLGDEVKNIQKVIFDIEADSDILSGDGTQAATYVTFWTDEDSLAGTPNLTWNGSTFALSGNMTVTGTVDGRDLSVDGAKLDLIESAATADQTGAEIKSLYEGEANTNAFTDAEQTKLSGIATGATVGIITQEEGVDVLTAPTVLNFVGTPVTVTDVGGVATVTILGGGAASVTKVGTPVDNQIGVWTGDGTIEGTTGLTYDGITLNAAGDLVVSSTFDLAITNITQANPAVVTVADTSRLATSDTVSITGVVGMVEVNDLSFTITVLDGTTFSLDGIDSLGYTAYTSGGTAAGPAVLTYDGVTLNVEGDITVSGTVDGRDIATDGTKLDGIATGATVGIIVQEEATPVLTAPTTLNFVGTLVTVTDVGGVATVTVTGDGAGDVVKVGTPVDNQVGVWTGDGSIEGTAGLTYDGVALGITGNITVSGTVDGRDLATDGTKLDGIATGATVGIIVQEEATPVLTAPTTLNFVGSLVTVTDVGGVATVTIVGDGAGDVVKVGTPVDNQVGVWTGDGTIEGTIGLTYDGVALGITGNITVSGTVDGRDLATDGTKLDGIGAGANVAKVGTPVDNQVGVWTGDGTIEGDANFTWDGTTLTVAGPVVNTISINAQTGTAYTMVLADQSKLVTMDNAAANTLTVPTNATVAYPIGTTITIAQIGAGATTITGDTGVTVNGTSGGSSALAAQWSKQTLYKAAADTWYAL